jgi:diadenosine tetraphosphate (Ap4A) HIT family hydrolase
MDNIFNGPDTLSAADVPWTNPIKEDFQIKVFQDKFPVTSGHLLFVPKYNSIPVLMEAIEDAIRHGKNMVLNHEYDGFNIGINYGEAAGQTIQWPHVHLIPRRLGDVPDPTGGVRHVIPGKGNYRDPNFR